MRKHNYILRLMIVFLFVATMFTSASAATATKVSSKIVGNGSSEYRLITGYTSKGKKVWSWKSRTYTRTELTSSYYKVKGSYVYVIERGRFVRIKKSNGKVVTSRTTSYAEPGPAMAVDSSGNVYNSGYYSNRVVKFNKYGRVKATRTVSSKYTWPYKITFVGTKIRVYYDMNNNSLLMKKSNLK